MRTSTAIMWPFRHLGLKALSVGLAALLWLVVAGEETVERGLRIPLELQQFPEGLELQGEAPALVDVRVRGSSGALSRVGPGDVVAVLDLHAAGSGQRLLSLTPDQVRTPFGVQVVQVAPATVALVFERTRTRRVSIAPVVEGIPAPGYIVGKITADPGGVEVVGPEGAVEGAAEAVTEPVSVNGARETVTRSVNVGVLDPSLRLKSPRSTTVTVQVLPGPIEGAVADRPVRFQNLGAKLTAQAFPSVVQVILRAGRKDADRVGLEDIVAYVDLTGLGAGEYPLPVRVDASRQAGVSRIDPATVRVRITSARR